VTNGERGLAVTYRDDREALHAKTEALEHELAEARRDAARWRTRYETGAEAQSARSDSADRAELLRHGAVARAALGSVVLATGLMGAIALQHRTVGYATHVGQCLQMFTEAVHASGRVVAAVNAPVAVGQPCTVDVSPVPMRRFNCRVEVRCGGATLYGQPSLGYTQCTVEQGRPVRALDPWSSSVEGDPAVQLDLDAGRVLVSDEGPGSSVTVVLDR
jgi:hypothetical protein